MDKPYNDQKIEEQENYEDQPLTDPDVHEDFGFELGADGEYHTIIAMPEEVSDNAEDD